MFIVKFIDLILYLIIIQSLIKIILNMDSMITSLLYMEFINIFFFFFMSVYMLNCSLVSTISFFLVMVACEAVVGLSLLINLVSTCYNSGLYLNNLV